MVRFGEFKAMQEDLTHLEQLHCAASDRLARLEASDSEVAPQVEILEAASVPQLPWRPLYARDAGISLGAAVALGFLAIWLLPPAGGGSGGPWRSDEVQWPAHLLCSPRSPPVCRRPTRSRVN